MKHRLTKKTWIIIAIVLFAVLSAGTALSSVLTKDTSTPHAQSTATSPAQRAKVVSTVTPTHDRPHLSGSISDFYGVYGKPEIAADAQNTVTTWLVDATQSIDVGAERDATGKVIRIIVAGPDTWTDQKAMSYCSGFLPDDATIFNKDDAIHTYDYHSSEGDIAVSAQQASCVMNFFGQ